MNALADMASLALCLFISKTHIKRNDNIKEGEVHRGLPTFMNAKATLIRLI